jgi:threonine dehydratase
VSGAYDLPTLADVDAAHARVRGCAWHTPLVRSAWLSDRTGADVWLKLEMLQTTGSFKIRGALNALSLLKAARPDVTTIVTASAGNHGKAVALAARLLGLRARVHVPSTAPAAKRDAIRALGAELVEAPTYDEAEARARQDDIDSGRPFISPYNHPDVIAGAATITREVLSDAPDVDTVIMPLGGGGLIAGAAVVARAHARPVEVIGAEIEASPVFTTALAAGEITPVVVSDTLADGLAGNLEPGSRTFEFVRDHVDRVALVAESSVEVAMRELLKRDRTIVEGSSATGVGVLLQSGRAFAGRKIAVYLTGRNVNGSAIAQLM